MKWNGYKRRNQNISMWNIGICILTAMLLLCSIFMIRNGKGTEPDNPLNNQVEAAIEQELEDEKNLPKESEKPRESQRPEESEEPRESQRPEESEEPRESQRPEESEIPQADNPVKESEAPKTSEEVKVTNAPGVSDIENKEPEKGEDVNSDGGITPGEDTDKVYFTTSIKDGEIVKHTHYEFTIMHLYDDLQVDEERIYVNDVIWPQFKGYVLLEYGENTIRIMVRYIDEENKVITVYKDYRVIVQEASEAPPVRSAVPVEPEVSFEPSKEPEKEPEPSRQPEPSQEPVEDIVILTNLDNQIVYREEFSFLASWTGGTKNASMQIYFNGAPLSGTEDYHVKLKIGNNSFSVKVYDVIDGKNVTKEKAVQVKYIPTATEETAPEIIYINVSDNMEIVGDKFILDIQAGDYVGNRIYSNGLQVKLNGTVYSYRWENDYTSYDLKLEGGDNLLQVRVTDKDGRYVDYQYNLKCTTVADGEPVGTAMISMDADVLGLGTLMEPTEVTIYQGEPLSYVLVRILEENGFECNYNGTLDQGFYLSRVTMTGIAVNVQIPSELEDAINEDGLEWKEQCYEDSLGEFDYCQGAGWMYSVNGHFTNYCAADCYLKNGDVVRIRFTLAYGKDVGGNEGGRSYDIPWLK